MLGEKGIGRLAIALLGQQVLVLTRAAYGDKTDQVGAAFINWSLFRCPGITLDEVEIPIRILDSSAPPSRSTIGDMINEVRANVVNLKKKIGSDVTNSILHELEDFKIDPKVVLAGLGEPSLFGENGKGLCFLIQPANEQIERDVELDRKQGDQVSDLRRQLLGFSNTMLPGSYPSRIATRFRYWPTNERPEGDLIKDREFFTPQEFEQADHRIRGTFDEKGAWTGTVEIYNEPPIEHGIPWRGGSGRESACGPFTIDLAIIQGSRRDSRLPNDEHTRMIGKLEAIGGLYIYRDGIRVSPYGSPEQDFLRFEERRSRAAGYYFFSHRRMFGAIRIAHERNPKLTDKAGREGLQENQAYRDFRDILIGFFVQLAADYFRTTSGEEPGIWERLRDKMKRTEAARKARDDKTKHQRAELNKAHESFFSRSKDDGIEQAVAEILEWFERELTDKRRGADPRATARAIQTTERTAQKKLGELRESLLIEIPPDLGFTKTQSRDHAAYETKMEQLEKESFRVASEAITANSARALEEMEGTIESEERVQSLVADVMSDARETIDEEASAARQSVARIADGAEQLLNGIETHVSQALDRVESEIRVHVEEGLDPEQLAEVRYDLAQGLLTDVQATVRRLRRLRAQIDDIMLDAASGEPVVSSLDMTAALEEAVLGLEEEAGLNFELVQLGMAIETIDHEFRSSVNGIRRSLRRLRRWGKANEQLDALITEIEGNFAHLDGYLRLFTPLQRRLYRRKIPVCGEALRTYLERLFKDRLESNEIELQATKAFDESVVVAFPSMFYPVFINLVDNAIFWLADAAKPRVITLDIDGDNMTVKDTGPGVAERDKEAIFERGFTRKPGGRGLGLYIAREALRREGLNLTVESPAKGSGAVFRIVGALSTEEGHGE
jgi:signal transduction histidine kinase